MVSKAFCRSMTIPQPSLLLSSVDWMVSVKLIIAWAVECPVPKPNRILNRISKVSRNF